MGVDYYLYYIYYSFLGMPFIIRVSIVSLSVFVPLYFLCAYVYIRRIRRENRIKNIDEELERNYRDTLQMILTSKKTLLPGDFDQLLPQKLKKINAVKMERFSRLISSICKENEDVYVNYENNKTLLDLLGIRQFWEKKLKHGSAMQKRNSLLRLDNLNIRVSGAVLTDLTYNRNLFLRKRSRSSFLNFTHSNPYKFLEEGFDENLNDWDKIELHHILERQSNKRSLPNLASLILRSEDLKFQCFLVDEIAFFNQKENIPTLIQLIKDSKTDSLLLKHCINALSDMQYKEIEPELIKLYPMQHQYVQQAIIDAVSKLKTRMALPFLIESFNNAVDNERKILVLSAIYNYGREGREYFDALQRKHEKEEESLLLFEHVSNPLLSIN